MRLSGESSKTPVQWQEWGDEPFRKAREHNKPVLLGISATWCHWCHVMDQNTYSDPEVSAIINSEFIPVRVDNDKRPDINRRYNMGGWPTTAFLTPNGGVISGGTYFPPNQFKLILREIADYWTKNRDRGVQDPPSSISDEMALEQEPRKGDLTRDIIEEVVGSVVSDFDQLHGGFGFQPKFPHTDALELALARYHVSKNREFLRIVTKTLQGMANGGVYDREAGGFFRYSTTRDWSVPHFEKMCEDNAKLLTVYLHAFQVTGDEAFAKTAHGIVEYLQSTLSDEQNGGFYGSQDADEHYYYLKLAERAKHQAPYVDKTIYANWNGMMISAYLLAAEVLSRPELRTFALKSLARVLELCHAPSGGVYHYHDGQRHMPDLLGDQFQIVGALLDAYQSTGNREHVQTAEAIADNAIRTLYDNTIGGFFDAPTDPNAPGFLKRPAKPLDENSVAALQLARIHHVTGKEIYVNRARETLATFAETYPPYGIMAAGYALALELVLNEPNRIVIVGSAEDNSTKGLIVESLRSFDPRKTLLILDPQTDASRIQELGYPVSKEPTAYVCVGTTCSAPITEPREIRAHVAKLIAQTAR